ncbi:hypothetical protein BJ741DRAFT_601458, partial [Chytriomyces cf. hyalinus JEL632]
MEDGASDTGTSYDSATYCEASETLLQLNFRQNLRKLVQEETARLKTKFEDIETETHVALVTAKVAKSDARVLDTQNKVLMRSIVAMKKQIAETTRILQTEKPSSDSVSVAGVTWDRDLERASLSLPVEHLLQQLKQVGTSGLVPVTNNAILVKDWLSSKLDSMKRKREDFESDLAEKPVERVFRPSIHYDGSHLKPAGDSVLTSSPPSSPAMTASPIIGSEIVSDLLGSGGVNTADLIAVPESVRNENKLAAMQAAAMLSSMRVCALKEKLQASREAHELREAKFKTLLDHCQRDRVGSDSDARMVELRRLLFFEI